MSILFNKGKFELRKGGAKAILVDGIPRPTPTPTTTPTVTVTPSPTTICDCFQYEITNYYTSSKTVYYIGCHGTTTQSIVAVGNGLQTYIDCALDGSVYTLDNECGIGETSNCITWVRANTPCDNACVTPTPTTTPTPTATPISVTPTTTTTVTNTQTATPTSSNGCISCRQYEITNYYSSTQTVYYVDCNGVESSQSCAGNGAQTYITCAQENTLYVLVDECAIGQTSNCVTWVASLSTCGSICPTQTPSTTQTPTPSITSSQTPTQTPTPSITASPSATVTPSVTSTVTQTPTPSITASQTQSPTNTQTATQTPTPSITSSQTQTPTPSITASQTQSPTNTQTATQTPTPSITASQTETPTPSITASQTQTPTPSITASQTQTPTPSITASQTETPTPSITASQTQTQTQTPTPSITASQTETPTPSITASQTQTPTNTATMTQTPTPSITASQTQTPTNTATMTQTPTPSITASQTQTQTQTPTPSITASQTQTPTPSITASQTQTQTQTPTPSITASQTQTPTPSITASQTQTQTQTPTPSITASQTQTPTPSTTTTLTATPTQTPTPSITASQTQTPTPSTTTTLTATPTQTPTPSITASQTQTPTPSTTTTLTATPTQTPTPSITASPTQTPTPSTTTTLTATPTQTPTPSITASPTQTPTPSTTTTLTATPTQTPTPSITATRTQTPTPSTTTTLTATPTQTPTPSTTTTLTATPTQTPTNTSTFTPTPTNTPLLSCVSCTGTGWEPYSSTQCVRITTGPATAPAFTVSLVSAAFPDYTDFGTRFYDTGFNYDGTGTILQTNTTNVVWRKTPGLLDGPLNRSGKSGSTIQNFIWYGFSACLTGITTSQTYYVGIGADNEYRLVLDGQEILNTYTPSTSGNTNNFRYWHVYPVQLDAGNHSLELYGMNDPGAGLNPHSFGMEIYNNTLSQLTAATSVNSLNIIWSSSGRTTAEIVQNNAGYYLSSGYTCNYPAVYSVCSGNCVTYEYCYAPGITPTPTRSATPTPTASVTPTKTPTGTPTQTPTQTPTPSPVYFSDITSDPKASGSEACTSIFFNPDPTVGNNTTFCNSTTLTNPSYGAFATGTYYISYGGNYVQVSITNGNNTATVTSSCTVCPTPTSTPTNTPTPTPTPTTPSTYFVDITIYGPTPMTCGQNYTLAALANYNVDTDLDVEVYWNGDLGGYLYGTITIQNGTSCSSITPINNIDCLGEFFSGESVTLDPSAFGNQIYQVSGTNTSGLYPC